LEEKIFVQEGYGNQEKDKDGILLSTQKKRAGGMHLCRRKATASIVAEMGIMRPLVGPYFQIYV
jgi:hypothetical protein